ncbi:metallophosphoesterase family protein [Litchfieldia salsa]|uniref:DNA repair exonuclease SbcCD nuclease subunit n=1 Tax=Litchfieldia salsa TaxID=930152 RepID=A0A1H0UWS1_9BACI|nr:DNA repair exonuclease [Litchfieldia salsa]SDP70378.1 DNA repair exonuclease SbcCD nuclease subunit [Litchfieldia salsa]
MKSVRFLHIADLHLDSPFIGLKKLPEQIYKRIRESTFQSFTRLISLAIREKVDFMIIAGDIFDQENRSIRAQARFRKELQRLSTHSIQVYIVHGNHDHVGAEWYEIEWPDHVHVFKSDEVEVKTFTKDLNSRVHIYGFSYPQRAVTENMTKYYTKKEDADFHIGILHGSVEGAKEHNQYAPFKVEQLLQKKFDYWALGHIHKSQVLSNQPLIMYPGNIQGRHRKESGDKGGYIVHLTAEDAIPTFHKTADIIWEHVSISINNMSKISELIDHLFQVINGYRKGMEAVFLSIELTGNGELHPILMDSLVLEDVLHMIQEGEEELENFVYVISLKVYSQIKIDRESIKSEASFLGDLVNIIDSYDYTKDAINPLYGHPIARRFLDELTKAEEEEILKQAEELLLNSIYNQRSIGGHS